MHVPLQTCSLCCWCWPAQHDRPPHMLHASAGPGHAPCAPTPDAPFIAELVTCVANSSNTAFLGRCATMSCRPCNPCWCTGRSSCRPVIQLCTVLQQRRGCGTPLALQCPQSQKASLAMTTPYTPGLLIRTSAAGSPLFPARRRSPCLQPGQPALMAPCCPQAQPQLARRLDAAVRAACAGGRAARCSGGPAGGHAGGRRGACAPAGAPERRCE